METRVELVVRTHQEGCPSGQREQTVNLPAYAFEGSNPSPSTNPFGSAGKAQLVGGQPSNLEFTRSKTLSPSSSCVTSSRISGLLASIVKYGPGEDAVTT